MKLSQQVEVLEATNEDLQRKIGQIRATLLVNMQRDKIDLVTGRDAFQMLIDWFFPDLNDELKKEGSDGA